MAVEKCWLNGVFEADPKVAAYDRGLTLGDGVFETMRLARRTIFRRDVHLARLEHGLSLLGIPVPAQLRSWLDRAVDESSLVDGRVRLTVTRGPGPAGVLPPATSVPTVVLQIGDRPAIPAETYSKGLTARVASGRRNERAFGSGIKTIGYTEAILALQEARAQGADEAIFLDTAGHVAEATASNLFLMDGGRLRTPPVSCGILPGVTRDVVLEIAAVIGLPTDQTPFGPAELIAADEGFFTSSLRGLAPLVQVDGRRIGAGVPGSVTRELMLRYDAIVERECGPTR